MIIGFRGIIGSGKTTLSNALANYFKTNNFRVVRLSLASPIKIGLKTMGVDKDTNLEIYRHLAQYIGQYCRNQDNDHWVKLLKQSIKDNTIYIIDDIRYPNEVSLVDKLFHVIRTQAVDEINKNPKILKHESEQMNITYADVNSLGITINNDGTVDQSLNKIINHFDINDTIIMDKCKLI